MARHRHFRWPAMRVVMRVSGVRGDDECTLSCVACTHAEGLDCRPARAGAESGSDDSEEGVAALGGQEPPEFYDPGGDDRAAAWVSRLRGGRRSDAILSCPQCFTTVCVECQQHATRDNQFRAMFVMNCRCVWGFGGRATRVAVTEPPASAIERTGGLGSDGRCSRQLAAPGPSAGARACRLVGAGRE